MLVSWRGETWGTFGGDVVVLEAPGLENWSSSGGAISGAGDGARTTVAWQSPASFTLSLLLLADSDADMAELMDSVKAVTAPNDDRDAPVFPFTYTIPGQEARTVFAKVTARNPPTDMQSVDRLRAANVLIQFVGDDPITYTAVETSAALDRADTLAITSEGWVSSGRWTWTVTGPVTNPQLSSSIDASAVIRYVGTVGVGEELVVDVTPDELVTELDEVDVYPAFDGGAGSGRPPQIFPVAPGAQTLTFGGTAGAGTATFAWREAKP